MGWSRRKDAADDWAAIVVQVCEGARGSLTSKLPDICAAFRRGTPYNIVMDGTPHTIYTRERASSFTVGK